MEDHVRLLIVYLSFCREEYLEQRHIIQSGNVNWIAFQVLRVRVLHLQLCSVLSIRLKFLGMLEHK